MWPRNPEPFPDLDVGVPELPARSRLFALAPIGVGTDRVEALSSYVVRLARAHSVSPRRLIREEFVRAAGQDSRVRSAVRQSNEIRTMNGLDHYAETFAALVSDLTAVPTVRYLTLLPLSDLLPRLGAGVLAKHPRWCARCMSQMIDDGVEAYRPLLWSVAPYTHCHQHGVDLTSACPHCGRHQPSIPRYPDLLHCAHCNQPLVDPKPAKNRVAGCSDLWTAGWLAELVSLLPQLDGVALRERFVNLLRQTIDLRTGGNRAELARRLGMPRPTLYNWLIRAGHPRLSQLLAIAHGLGLRPAALLESVVLPAADIITPPAPMNQSPRRRRLTQATRDDLLEAITTIADDEADVRTLKEVARALGYTRWALKYWFPVQCKTICAKNLAARNRAARAHDVARHQAVVEAVEEMSRRGDYPGRKRVSRLLPRGALITSPHMVDAYHEAVRQCIGRLPKIDEA